MLGGFASADFDSVNYVPSECPNWCNYSVGRSRVPRIVMFQPECGPGAPYSADTVRSQNAFGHSAAACSYWSCRQARQKDARRLRAALGFLQLRPGAPELRLLHEWADTWGGVGAIVTGLHRPATTST